MTLPFVTDYDPLSTASGSIDPLGLLQSYGALADLILPGVTTITNRSRYLSMMCHAIATAESDDRFPPGPAGLAGRRQAVEPLERLWALACVSARERGARMAADGFRGITYAVKAFRSFSSNGGRITPDFKLLKYQARTGAVGTYWTVMVSGQFVEPSSGALTSEGRELATHFPEPPVSPADRQKLVDPSRAHRVAMSPKALSEWADKCHLTAAKAEEKRLLADALRADDRRECLFEAMLRLHRLRQLPDEWDIVSLRRLRREFTRDRRATELVLPSAIDAVIAVEQFHEAALAVFDDLLWWGTEKPGKPVDLLQHDEQFGYAVGRVRETAQSVLQYHTTCIDAAVRRAIEGLKEFAVSACQSRTPADVLREVVRRHHRVQSGKLDGGAPKSDWVALEAGRQVLCPLPRFQRTYRPRRPTGRRLTHPYRFEQFAHMLRENGALPRG